MEKETVTSHIAKEEIKYCLIIHTTAIYIDFKQSNTHVPLITTIFLVKKVIY